MRWFNGGTQPLVPDGQWGKGVIMPGEYYDTDKTMTPPWILDAEAEAQTRAQAPQDAAGGDPTPTLPEPSPTVPDAPSEAHNAPDVAQPPADAGPTLHTLPNGDVINPAGDVVGHFDQNSNTGGNA